VALIEAGRLGQLRTGAVTGLAAKMLARAGLHEVGLIGTGRQAQSQLAGVAAALPIRRAYCFSRNAERRARFAQRMSDELNIEVVPVKQARDAVAARPLVITATTSREPVLDGDWLDHGALVCAVGSNWLHKAELDVTTVRRAGLVVCDSVEACRREAGDLAAAVAQGALDWSQAVELADIVSSQSSRPASPDAMTLFKSVGLAIEDVALGGKLLELARARGVGQILPIQ
jgi:ornithine cyclodeaminase/alanine dehydrogenase